MVHWNTKPDLSKKCSVCRGTGHDRGARPVIKKVPYVDDDGRKRVHHITVAQGSGCFKCCGTGERT